MKTNAKSVLVLIFRSYFSITNKMKQSNLNNTKKKGQRQYNLLNTDRSQEVRIKREKDIHKHAQKLVIK